MASTRLTLSDGWRAVAVSRDSEGNELSRSDWRQLLDEPQRLLDGGGERLKSDAFGSVVVRTIRLGKRDIRVVVKVQKKAAGFTEFPRWLRPAKAMRTFRTALKLQTLGIASEYPLAAVERRKGLWATCSVYISEYIEDSRNLYYFLRDDLGTFGGRESACRRAVAGQIAGILARLHKNGLWHRDAKSGNFLVRRQQDGSCRVILVDVDGIKPYRFCRRRCRFRSLVKLASTVLCHRSIHRSDYWRTFSIYCELTAVHEDRRRLFGELAMRAAAVRLLSMATSAMEGRATFVGEK